jgi:hypothetical protein
VLQIQFVLFNIKGVFDMAPLNLRVALLQNSGRTTLLQNFDDA